MFLVKKNTVHTKIDIHTGQFTSETATTFQYIANFFSLFSIEEELENHLKVTSDFPNQ